MNNIERLLSKALSEAVINNQKQLAMNIRRMLQQHRAKVSANQGE